MKTSSKNSTSASGTPWFLKPTSVSGIKSQEQLIGMIQNSRVQKFLAASVGVESDSDMPEWAERAAKEFGNSIQNLSQKRNVSEGYNLGFLFGIMSNLRPPDQQMEKPLLKFISSPELQSRIHADIREEPATEKAEFYDGFAEGLKADVVDCITGQMKILLLIGLLWDQSGCCNNVKELHEWLVGVLGANLTGSRDRIAKICQKIKFPLNDKGGRPKTKPRKGTAS
jgi:hypothetical protein